MKPSRKSQPRVCLSCVTLAVVPCSWPAGLSSMLPRASRAPYLYRAGGGWLFCEWFVPRGFAVTSFQLRPRPPCVQPRAMTSAEAAKSNRAIYTERARPRQEINCCNPEPAAALLWGDPSRHTRHAMFSSERTHTYTNDSMEAFWRLFRTFSLRKLECEWEQRELMCRRPPPAWNLEQPA